MNQADFLSMFDEPAEEKDHGAPSDHEPDDSLFGCAAKAEPPKAPPPVAPQTIPAPAPTETLVKADTALAPRLPDAIGLSAIADRKFAIVLAMCANPAYAALDAVAFVSRAEAILANLGAE
jgi:hypothetical protein